MANFSSGQILPQRLHEKMMGSAMFMTRPVSAGYDRSDCDTCSLDRFSRIVRIIELNYSDPAFSIQQAAEQLGMSESTLNRCLKVKGCRFSKILWEVRLSSAIASLRDRSRDVRISELAYSHGFKSPAHLSSKFRKLMGVSPRAFRRSMTGSEPENSRTAVSKKVQGAPGLTQPS